MRQIDNVRNDNIVVERNTNKELNIINIIKRVIDIYVDKRKVLEDVEKFTPGETSSSKNEFNSIEDLRKRFYPLKDYKYIFDNNKFLVIGSKGSGKTLCIQY